MPRVMLLGDVAWHRRGAASPSRASDEAVDVPEDGEARAARKEEPGEAAEDGLQHLCFDSSAANQRLHGLDLLPNLLLVRAANGRARGQLHSKLRRLLAKVLLVHAEAVLAYPGADAASERANIAFFAIASSPPQAYEPIVVHVDIVHHRHCTLYDACRMYTREVVNRVTFCF